MRLINAERYAEKIREHANVLRDENPTSIVAIMAAMSYDIAAAEAMKEPIIDAAPVVHAHWIEYYTDIMCSHCFATYKDEIVDTYQDSVDHRRYVGLEYCPHCGSIMDGSDDDADGETSLSVELRPVQADIDDTYYEYGRKRREGER